MKKVLFLTTSVVALLMLNAFALFSITDSPIQAAPDPVESDTMCCQFLGRCPDYPNDMNLYCDYGHNNIPCVRYVCSKCGNGTVIE